MSVEQAPRFHVPRQGELTAALKHGMDSLRAGLLSEEEFIARLERATHNVPQVFCQILDELDAGDPELAGYVGEVKISLLDCQALFQSGIEEMLAYAQDGDDFHLRFGWLLVEKGEEEYIRIVQALKRDAAGGEFAGAQDIIGMLAAQLRERSIAHDTYLQGLDRFEASSEETLEKVSQHLQKALQAARSYEGSTEEPFQEASQQASEAAEQLGALLLNLYHPS